MIVLTMSVILAGIQKIPHPFTFSLHSSNAVLSTKTSSTSKSSYTHNLPTFPAHVVKTVKQSHTIDTHPLK